MAKANTAKKAKNNHKQEELVPEKVKSDNAKAKKAFYRALDKLSKFCEENDTIVDRLREIVVEHNQALTEYKTTLRNVARISDNDRERAGRDKEFLVSKKEGTEFHVEPLLEVVTIAMLEKHHAVIPRTVYDFNEKQLFDMVGRKLIPEKVFKQAVVKTQATPSVRCPYDELKI